MVSFSGFSRCLRFGIHPALFLLILAAVPSTPAIANDFAALNQTIAVHTSHLQTLEQVLDRSDQRLVEPLTSLALSHMQANQFDAADQVLDRSVQIVRFNEGLYSRRQYDLLQLSVENNRNRGNWTAVNRDLDHLQWLYTERFEGHVDEQLNRLIWLSDFHLRGVFEDSLVRQIAHLRDATDINQLALDISRGTDASRDLRIQLLYDLVLKFHLETQGIRRGGSSGYEIRVLIPNSTFVDARKVGLQKRYVGGLRALQEIRALLQEDGLATPEALAMVELYLTDWKMLFNKTARPAADYAAVYGQLLAAGLPGDRIDAFFAAPAVLPSPRFHASLDAALNARQTAETAPGTLRLLEPSPNFPGYVRQTGAASDALLADKDWLAVRVTTRIDPEAKLSSWLGGSLQTVQGGGTVLALENLGVDDMEALYPVITHLEQIRFRPVVSAGMAVSTELTLEYLVPVPETARFELLKATALLTQR
ncbi:MAG: hypothetical protein RLZZ385_1518 [Pseudomonadota bacterium]|jgi:hypothetical protein